MKCCCYLRDGQDFLAEGKCKNERRFGESFKDMLCSREEFWEEDTLIAEIEELKGWMHQKYINQKTECERSLDNPKKMENLYFLWQMVQQNYQEETTNSKNPL